MMINEMKNSRSSDLLPMFYDCKYISISLGQVRLIPEFVMHTRPIDLFL